MNTFRTPLTAAALALVLSSTLGGCAVTSASSNGDPTPVVSEQPAGKVRAPDAYGTITGLPQGIDSVVIEFAPDAGYEYFEGTTFDAPYTAFPSGEDGVTLDPSSLKVGDRIQVWVGVCRESFPVQCDVERVELQR